MYDEQILYNVAHIKMCTEVEGPYKRCCIWFQGCNICCPNCINQDLQEFKVVHLMTLDELLQVVKDSKSLYDIEGITLSGGEPLLQNSLGAFCYEVKQLGLGIILFTGFYEQKIPKFIKDNIDLGLIGPYQEQKKDFDRFLIGSKNKRIVEYTNRYHNEISWFDMKKHEIVGEICFDKFGLFINGD